MHLNIGFSDDELTDHANAIVVALTDNPNFPTVTPPLTDVSTATTALRDAVAMPQGPAIAAALAPLTTLLQRLGQFLMERKGKSRK